MKVFNSTCNAFGSRIFGTRVDAKFDFNQWKYKQDPEEKSSFTDSNIQGPKYGNYPTVPLILDLSSREQHNMLISKLKSITKWTIEDREYLNSLYIDSLTPEKFTLENRTLPTIHLGPAGRRPAWA